LAVSLLGVYLREQPGHGIGPARTLDERPGKEPIDRVLAGFEHWLGDGPEREALRLLGLFDRPADAGCLRALRMAPSIPGLTEHLVSLDEAGWERVLARLERMRLIHVNRGSSRRAFAVDAHPLVREHFAELLKGSEAWRAAHRRLYKHLCSTTKDKRQPTLNDLQPLYEAVAHGCQAGMQQEAYDRVWVRRIRKGKKYYSTKVLGAVGSDLGAVTCFFERPWKQVSASLKKTDQAALFTNAALRLRAVGQMTDALGAARDGVQMSLEQKDWTQAATAASNLTELELTLGMVAEAVQLAKQSITYADRGRDPDWFIKSRTTHADALHQAGRRAEAKKLFRDAERIQAEREPAHRLLYLPRGFQYCDLLLAKAERAAWQTLLGSGRRENARAKNRPSAATCLASCNTVSDRAKLTLQIAESKHERIAIALDHLTLGRAALYASLLESGSRRGQSAHTSPSSSSDRLPAKDRHRLNVAVTELNTAVADLHRGSQQQYLPLAHLTRAWCSVVSSTQHRLLHQQNEALLCETNAQSDLDEAWEIAARSQMTLFLADIRLYRARLFHTVKPYPWAKTNSVGHARGPDADLAAARVIIKRCGYLRRKEELEDAKKALATGNAASRSRRRSKADQPRGNVASGDAVNTDHRVRGGRLTCP
jgi:hypothetical protein